jgi:hypothetical protein
MEAGSDLSVNRLAFIPHLARTGLAKCQLKML